MRFEGLRRQVAMLRARMPKEVAIQLRDGSVYLHPGPVIDFVVEGLRECYLGTGPIREACLNSDQVSISPRGGDRLEPVRHGRPSQRCRAWRAHRRWRRRHRVSARADPRLRGAARIPGAFLFADRTAAENLALFRAATTAA